MADHSPIRKPLSKVFDALIHLGPELRKPELDHPTVEVLLAEAMINLDEAHDAWMTNRSEDSNSDLSLGANLTLIPEEE